jgi:hypothetical protein
VGGGQKEDNFEGLEDRWHKRYRDSAFTKLVFAIRIRSFTKDGPPGVCWPQNYPSFFIDSTLNFIKMYFLGQACRQM